MRGVLPLLLSGCCVVKPPDPPPPGPRPAAVAEEEVADSPRALLVRTLSLREAEAACAEVEALTTDPVADLTWVAEEVTQPPWAGMRAAECLVVGHGAEVQATLERWVTDPGTRGLGLLVLGRLDALPEAVAVAVATAALERGPDREAAVDRIGRCTVEAVRALVVAEGG